MFEKVENATPDRWDSGTCILAHQKTAVNMMAVMLHDIVLSMNYFFSHTCI